MYFGCECIRRLARTKFWLQKSLTGDLGDFGRIDPLRRRRVWLIINGVQGGFFLDRIQGIGRIFCLLGLGGYNLGIP
jgi:hypothetical protein